MLRSSLPLVAFCSTVAVVACSSKSSSDGNTPDGGTSQEGGGTFAPGWKPDIGQIVSNGGPTIAAPKVVTVTWNADPNQAALEQFGDAIGASAYWRETTSEYGIGPATSGSANHVRIATPPPATQDASLLDAWVAAQLTDPKSGWPAWDPSTIYVVYIPTATQLMPHGATHYETEVGANKHVAFAVVDENGDGKPSGGLSPLEVATRNAAHEIAEVATNPHLFTDLGIVGFDAKHVAWSMAFADAELGDICEPNGDAIFKGPADLPFTLQRLWSNKAAVAGHNPCLPAPAEPYYSVTPLDLETVSVFVDTAPTAGDGWGYRIPIGSTKTIRVGFFSDRPMTAPWTITASEGSWFSPSENHRLTISVEKGSGNNGDVGTITVTANAQSTGAGNAVLMNVTAQAPGLPSHSIPILIGTY